MFFSYQRYAIKLRRTRKNLKLLKQVILCACICSLRGHESDKVVERCLPIVILCVGINLRAHLRPDLFVLGIVAYNARSTTCTKVYRDLHSSA